MRALGCDIYSFNNLNNLKSYPPYQHLRDGFFEYVFKDNKLEYFWI